jgi:hypothetical protein
MASSLPFLDIVDGCCTSACTCPRGHLSKDAHVGSLESLMEPPVGSSGSSCAVTGSLLDEGLGVLEESDTLEAGSWHGSLKSLSSDP